MKKSLRKRQIKRLKKLQDRWIGPLGLHWWHRLEFLYRDDRSYFQAVGDQQTVESVMITRTDWARLWAEVDVNLQMCAELDDNELVHVFLHEMCHIMVAAMKGDDPDLEELVVTRLAQAFMWVAEPSEQNKIRLHS